MKACRYKKGSMITEENDMDAPGPDGKLMPYEGGKVMGAGNYKGQKGVGASLGHQELKNEMLGHKPMAIGVKHGHKAM